MRDSYRNAKSRLTRTLARNEDEHFEDYDVNPLKKGDRNRINELIKLTRWCLYLLALLVAIQSVPFVRDAVSVLISLFGG